jgi:uncharacterized protein (TIGR03067 family)
VTRFSALLCLLLITAAVLAAPAPFPKPPKHEAELKKMQGKWVVVRRTLNGRDVTETANRTVEIIGDRIRFLIDGEMRTEWVVTLDVKKTPKVFDRKRVASKSAAAKGGKDGELFSPGIYRLEGDMLWLSNNSRLGDQVRPTDFEGKGRSETMYILKRLKP